MSEFFKKFFILNESDYARNEYNVKIKGGVKFVQTDKHVEIHVAINSFPPNLSNHSNVIVFCDDKFYIQKLPKSLNFTITLNEFYNLSNPVLIIANGSNAIAYAPSNLTQNVIFEIINTAQNNENIKNDFDSDVAEYNDELIATENYYEYNEHCLYDENVNAKTGDCPEKETRTQNEQPYGNETDVSEVEKHYVFYSAREKIDKLLRTHPKEKSLTEILPSSDFVLINYSDTDTYTVGKTVFDETTYFCYGVKGVYGKNNLENSRFIPLSPIDTEGEGYYLVFQDALTGKTIITQ